MNTVELVNWKLINSPDTTIFDTTGANAVVVINYGVDPVSAVLVDNRPMTREYNDITNAGVWFQRLAGTRVDSSITFGYDTGLTDFGIGIFALSNAAGIKYSIHKLESDYSGDEREISIPIPASFASMGSRLLGMLYSHNSIGSYYIKENNWYTLSIVSGDDGRIERGVYGNVGYGEDVDFEFTFSDGGFYGIVTSVYPFNASDAARPEDTTSPISTAFSG